MSLRPRIARDPVARMGSKREEAPGHIDMIKLLPCAVFGSPPPCEPHHLQRGIDNMPAGVGRTHEDRWAIPISRRAHDEIHTGKESVLMGEEAWLASKGVPGRELANALWACRSKGLRAYQRVMWRHLQTLGITDILWERL